MSGPLVLTIYPPIVKRPAPSDLNPFSYEDWHEDRAVERKLSAKKRLTSEEISAEYWYAATDMAPSYPYRDREKFDPIGLILYRFASLPHYDEAQL